MFLLEYQFIQFYFRCASDKGVSVDLQVRGKCFASKPKTEINQLDFGVVKCKSDQVAQILATNTSVIDVSLC